MDSQLAFDHSQWAGGAQTELGARGNHHTVLLGGACLTDGRYNTNEWKRVSREARQRDGWRCTCFGEDALPLQVHHVQPCRWGGAAFALENLRSVCQPCHDAVHWELCSLSVHERQCWKACYDAFRRVRGRRRGQGRAQQLQWPLDLPVDPVPSAAILRAAGRKLEDRRAVPCRARTDEWNGRAATRAGLPTALHLVQCRCPA